MATTEESPLILPDPTDWTVMQEAQSVMLNADMRTLEADLEAEATQEGRLVMLAAAAAAGIDLTAFGWQPTLT